MASTSMGLIMTHYYEFLMMPLLTEQHLQWRNLPSSYRSDLENYLIASFVQKTYRVSLAPGSFLIFTIFCLTSIAWCLIRVLPTMFSTQPLLTSFPEVNFASKLGKDVKILSRIKGTSMEVERIMGGIRVFLREVDDEIVYERWELQDLS